MNNRDKLKAMTNEELAQLLCDAIDVFAGRADVHTCDHCPVQSLCRKGHNGFLAKLEGEVE